MRHHPRAGSHQRFEAVLELDRPRLYPRGTGPRGTAAARETSTPEPRGSGPAAITVRIDRCLQPTIPISKNGHPSVSRPTSRDAASRCTPRRIPTRPGSPRSTPMGSLRRAGLASPAACSAASASTSVPLTPRRWAGSRQSTRRRPPASARQSRRTCPREDTSWETSGRTRQPRPPRPSRVNGPGLEQARGVFPPRAANPTAYRPSRRSFLRGGTGASARGSAVSTDPRGTMRVPSVLASVPIPWGCAFVEQPPAPIRRSNRATGETRLPRWWPKPTAPVHPASTPSSPPHDHRGWVDLGIVRAGPGLPPSARGGFRPGVFHRRRVTSRSSSPAAHRRTDA